MVRKRTARYEFQGVQKRCGSRCARNGACPRNDLQWQRTKESEMNRTQRNLQRKEKPENRNNPGENYAKRVDPERENL